MIKRLQGINEKSAEENWELIKLGLMLLGTLVVIHVAILVIHNATKEETPPPGGDCGLADSIKIGIPTAHIQNQYFMPPL